jgi:hypothetical protein
MTVSSAASAAPRQARRCSGSVIEAGFQVARTLVVELERISTEAIRPS